MLISKRRRHTNAPSPLAVHCGSHPNGRTPCRYCRHGKIERLWAWLENYRRIKVRHECYAENYHGIVLFGCLPILARAYSGVHFLLNAGGCQWFRIQRRIGQLVGGQMRFAGPSHVCGGCWHLERKNLELNLSQIVLLKSRSFPTIPIRTAQAGAGRTCQNPRRALTSKPRNKQNHQRISNNPNL